MRTNKKNYYRRILKLTVLFAVILTESLFAFELGINTWNDYSGELSEKPIRMSLYRFNNNQVRGHYYYVGTENKIYLAGKVKEADITIWSIVNQQPLAMFKGRTDSLDRFGGLYIEKNKIKTEFKFYLGAITGGMYGKRYYFVDGTTNEIEQFAKQVKQAILSKDKQWLSMKVIYPFKTTLDGKKQITISNQKQFIAHYEHIFHQIFIENIKKVTYFDLFSNSHGVMMGSGEIWINSFLDSTKKNYIYRITAINNFE